MNGVLIGRRHYFVANKIILTEDGGQEGAGDNQAECHCFYFICLFDERINNKRVFDGLGAFILDRFVFGDNAATRQLWCNAYPTKIYRRV